MGKKDVFGQPPGNLSEFLMPRKIRLINLLRGLIVFSLTAQAIILASFQINKSFHQFEQQAKSIRRNFIENQKAMVKREVERVVEQIDIARIRTIAQVKQELMKRVEDTCALAEGIYNRTGNDSETKKLIITSLRRIRFNHEYGYCFIIDDQGNEIFADKRRGISSLNCLYLQIHKTINDITNSGKLKSEEGYNYLYPKTKNGVQPKETVTYYTKKFPPCNWIIGCAYYPSEVNRDLQQKLLGDIGKIRFGAQGNGYIFVVSYDGVTLMNDTKPQLIGKNIWDLTDPNGVKVIQAERRAAAKPNGDFIYYTWDKPSNQSTSTKEIFNKPSPKVSFIMGIDDWRWIVGAGVYLDDCEKEIAILHQNLHRHQQSMIVNIAGTTLAIILIFIALLAIVSRYLEKDYRIFYNFFKRAANSSTMISQNELRFKEFYELSGYANQMLHDRSEAQRQLLTEHERLTVTLQSIGDAVIATDAEGHIVLLNPIAEKLTGWTHQQALQQPISEIFKIIDKNTRNPRPNPINEVLRRQETVTLNIQTILLNRNGKEYDIEDSAAPIRDTRQTIIGVVLVFRDVTTKLATERELLRQRQFESLGTLAAGIAHDFNNLMTSIFGNIALARTLVAPENSATEFLLAAENSIGRAKALTAQLLTFAKGGAPTTEIQAIGGIIRETANFSIRGSKIKLEFDIANDLWAVDVDKNQLSQVISNLVINAEQAMAKSGSTIYLQAVNIDNQDQDNISTPLKSRKVIKISIKDEGCGIPEKNIEKILEPYFTTKELGNGLGLATCNSIIKRHRGHLTFTSTVNQGTTVNIYLPAAADHSPAHNQSTKAKNRR